MMISHDVQHVRCPCHCRQEQALTPFTYHVEILSDVRHVESLLEHAVEAGISEFTQIDTTIVDSSQDDVVCLYEL